VGFIWIIIAILLTAYGQVVLKWRMSLMGPMPSDSLPALVYLLKALLDVYVVSTFAAAFVAGLAWMAALTRFELTFVYPFMAVTFAIVLICGWLFLGEAMNVNKVACIGLIFVALWIGSR
jgi:multidrug transporter EmrE-like cation transporter